MDNDALAALKAAYENAAVGKWTYRAASWQAWYDIHDGEGTKLGEAISSSDAAFIVAAHERLPALLAEVERLRWYKSDFIEMADTLQAAIKEFGIDVPAGRKVAEVIVEELRRHVSD